MSNIFLRQAFSPSCPSGGTWYACASGSSFVGCCTSDPCQLGCSDGSLRPASFDPAFFGQFPDQQCSAGSRWYTCAKSSPPFLGCCKSNACSAGACPAGDLTAGFLSSNAALAAPFLSSTSADTGSPSSLSTPSIIPLIAVSAGISSASSSSEAGSTQTSAPTTVYIYSVISSTSISSSTIGPTRSGVVAQSGSSPVPASSSMPTGAIAGSAVGGVAVVAVILGILFFCFRRRAARRNTVEERSPPRLISKETSYTDSSPITPIPAYKPFAFPPSDKKYVSSASNTPTIMTPTLRPHPAYSFPPYTPAPPTHPSPGLLSRSLSVEPAAETHDIYHTAELDGRAIGGANPRNSTSTTASRRTERARISEVRSHRIETAYVAYRPQMQPQFEQQRPVRGDKGGFV